MTRGNMIKQVSKNLLILFILLFGGGALIAQDSSTNVASTKADWSVFTSNNPKQCWGVSAPILPPKNTRDGRMVSVKRSDILLFVSYDPSNGISGQLSFTGGYPFDEDSRVDVNVDGQRFQMFTSGEWAWAATDEIDKEIITAMKRGAKAVITGRSSRGTKTEDTFSLKGFTAAVEDASKRCK